MYSSTPIIAFLSIMTQPMVREHFDAPLTRWRPHTALFHLPFPNSLLHHFSTFKPLPRGLCSLTQEYTYSIIYGFIFHLNTSTVPLLWERPDMTLPPPPHVCLSATSRPKWGSVAALPLQYVYHVLLNHGEIEQRCWQRVALVRLRLTWSPPCEDASLLHNMEVYQISVFAPFLQVCMLCGYKQRCVRVCVWQDNSFTSSLLRLL